VCVCVCVCVGVGGWVWVCVGVWCVWVFCVWGVCGCVCKGAWECKHVWGASVQCELLSQD